MKLFTFIVSIACALVGCTQKQESSPSHATHQHNEHQDSDHHTSSNNLATLMVVSIPSPRKWESALSSIS